jgi:predicted patatin/cPLA2 family phospholipase
MPTELGFATGDVDVMSLLLQRRDARSVPGRRDDGHRVALVVEGGGMRGVYVAGMVRQLGAMGLRDSFDEMFAVSAGALTAAGLIARRTEHLASVYWEDLCGDGFIDVHRMLRGRGPLVSLDFLLDSVVRDRRRFDLQCIVDGDIPLRAVATGLHDLGGAVLTDLQDAAAWRLALHASACIPLWAGPPVELGGLRYVDGFVADPLPVARAVDSGATHVLALLARGPGERPSPAGRVSPLLRPRLDRLAPGLAAAMSRRGRRHVDAMGLVTGRHRRGGARVLGLRPLRPHGVRALTTDPGRLRRAAAAGEESVVRTVAATAW